ncbi:MAG TPA: cyclic nucleotide-binding domain-containing protein [Kiloniellales bacterium]|nr:cyclic nucleotide-binding domain-containing protein [Kiloniellales bacterium]
MSLDQEVDILRRIPLFANIEPAKLKLLAFTSQRLTYKPGQPLVRQGDLGDAAYILVDGVAEVVLERGGDDELVLTELGKNAIVGEIAILCDVPRTATVRAKTPLTTLRITKEVFFRLVRDFPEIGVEVMRTLAQRLEHTTQQLTAARAAANGSGS